MDGDVRAVVPSCMDTINITGWSRKPQLSKSWPFLYIVILCSLNDPSGAVSATHVNSLNCHQVSGGVTGSRSAVPAGASGPRSAAWDGRTGQDAAPHHLSRAAPAPLTCGTSGRGLQPCRPPVRWRCTAGRPRCSGFWWRSRRDRS